MNKCADNNINIFIGWPYCLMKYEVSLTWIYISYVTVKSDYIQAILFILSGHVFITFSITVFSSHDRYVGN